LTRTAIDERDDRRLQALRSERALIVVILIIILFLGAQRYFVNGLVGAVKG
jgi:ABC-type maltose transport system permease subunit